MTVAMAEAGKIPSLDTLKMFEKLFLDMKRSSLTVFIKYSIMYGSALYSNLSKFMSANRMYGVNITNIAGEDEGFGVCGKECTGYTLSSAQVDGVGESVVLDYWLVVVFF